MSFLQYPGGKGVLAPKIIPYIPAGEVYVEPFCGAAGVFFRKKPSRVEVLNDLDGNVVNFFRVLQDQKLYEALKRRLDFTPYSYDEFIKSHGLLKAANWNETHESMIERAWAFFVYRHLGFLSATLDTDKIGKSWGRSVKSSCADRFRDTIPNLWGFRSRLIHAHIDNRDALKVIDSWDSPSTVFYVDPPYVTDTRKSGHMYQHEMTDTMHQALVDALMKAKGRVAISGYGHSMYEVFTKAGWSRHEFKVVCQVAGKTRHTLLKGGGSLLTEQQRTEVLWVSPDKGFQSVPVQKRSPLQKRGSNPKIRLTGYKGKGEK